MFFDQSVFLNPLPDMPIVGSSNSKATKDMMSKIWTNGDNFLIGWKTLWEMEKFLLLAISPFSTMFSKNYVDALK